MCFLSETDHDSYTRYIIKHENTEQNLSVEEIRILNRKFKK